MLTTQTLTNIVGMENLGRMENRKASEVLRSLRALGKGNWESKANRTQGPPRQFSMMVPVPVILLKTANSFPQGQCSPPVMPLSLPHRVKQTGDSKLVTTSSRKQCLFELEKATTPMPGSFPPP